MPGWILDLIVKLAVTFGIPYLFERFPAVMKKISEYIPDFEKLIRDILDGVKTSRDVKKDTVRLAQQRLRECTGIGCAPEIKK